jgi:SAM-dependent methyltransferase
MSDRDPEQSTYWERVSESRWGAYITERERLALAYALDRVSRGTALEVGCEGGRWSALVSGRGWDVVCTDVDPDSLARCAERIPSARCVLVSPDDHTLPVRAGEVDLLLVYEVNEVVESPWFPAEAARVLRPGGLLVCSYWNARSLRGLLYRTLAKVSRRSTDGIRRFQGYYQGRATGRSGTCCGPMVSSLFGRKDSAGSPLPATAIRR